MVNLIVKLLMHSSLSGAASEVLGVFLVEDVTPYHLAYCDDLSVGFYLAEKFPAFRK